MPSPQKAKGSSWERDVAKYLTELYRETFIRAPGSGAYVGGSNNQRKQFLHEGQIRSFKGDIVPGQSFPKLNAECKSYADFPFHQLFQGTVNKLEEWITQCMDAADEGDFNILFMKFNRKGKYVAVQAQPNHTRLLFTRHFNYGSRNHGHWFIMDMDLFFELNSVAVQELCSKQLAATAA
jgi:hypothetical protein